MKRSGLILVLASCLCSTRSSAKTYHVSLQGFHYDSSGVDTGWYEVLKENAQRQTPAHSHLGSSSLEVGESSRIRTQ